MPLTALTDRGRLRPRNEDAVAVDEALGLAALADGMGGLADGDLASREAVAAALAWLKGRDDGGLDALARAVQSANARVRALADERGAMMGTTLELLALDGDGACRLAHVGDSRAYLWRDGRLGRLTRDDSLVQDLVDRGVMNADEAARSARRNVITRAVGLEAHVEPALMDVNLGREDVVLLCSDGLWDTLGDAGIAARLVTLGDDLPRCAAALVASANAAGGADNIAVVLARR